MTPLVTSPWWSSWSESVWRASWQGALCALVVWGVARALPRLPAAVRAGLWWLVALKFVLTLGWPRPLPLALLPVEAATAAQSQTSGAGGAQSQTPAVMTPLRTASAAPGGATRLQVSRPVASDGKAPAPAVVAPEASLARGAARG
ncbi:peptidase M56, partial [Corallococcus sp. 4LFB]